MKSGRNFLVFLILHRLMENRSTNHLRYSIQESVGYWPRSCLCRAPLREYSRKIDKKYLKSNLFQDFDAVP